MRCWGGWMIPKPPKKMCIDSFEYREYLGENKWSEPEYAPPITIQHCRIERWPEYTASVAGKQLLYNAVIFCYEGITTPLPKFKMQSKIMFDGQEHTVTRVTANYEPFVNKIYSYELEVV